MDWQPLTATKQFTFDDYTVAWITALPHEKAAARNMLDEIHINPPQSELDKNVYTFGSICGHNVVIVCQGDMGTEAAAVVAARMDMTFRNIRFGLLVGIAGGVPDRKDIRLGDVVISQGDGMSGGVVSHDHGKVTPMGFMSRPFLNDVPELLKKAFVELKSQLMDRDNQIPAYISAATARNPRFFQFHRPDLVDRLFKSHYVHVDPRDDLCDMCEKTEEYLVPRKPRVGLEDLPFVHFGVVASGNQVIKDGNERLRISKAHPSVIAVEMEAAGLMNIFGCATIRGICDYADSHKNDGWQNYAAAAAAACAREVLEIIPVAKGPITLSAEEIDCLQCLCNSEYGSYENLIPKAIPGTCSWILQNQKLTMWKNEQQSSILWLSGGPGTGKSVLSSFLISELQSYRSDTSFPGTTLFFLFKDNDDTQKTASSALSALLHQLLTVKKSLVKYAMQEFRTKGRKITNEFSTLCKILRQAIADNDCGPVTCIVDGLDECESSSREHFVEFFTNLCSGSARHSNPFKLLITSRPDASIEDLCYKSSIIRLKIEDETTAINNDIALFVKDKVQEYNSRNELSDTMRTYLEEQLVVKADRTFLWVSLILQVMKRKPRPNKKEKMDNLLDALPRKLDAVYEKILQQVTEDAEDDDDDDDTQDSRKRLLHILVAAARPLSLDEMGIALVIQSSDTSYEDLDMHGSIGDTIERLCGPFVRIIDSKIYLVHQSAKEFLVRGIETRLTGQQKWRHALDTVESNYILSEICITYLLFIDFESDPLILTKHPEDDEHRKFFSERGGISMDSDVREEMQIYASRHSLLDYAAKNWGEHFRAARINERVPLLKGALDVCDTQTLRFMTWFQVYWTTVDPKSLCPEGLTPLIVASQLGHEAIVRLLLKRGVALELTDSSGGTALHRASENGHEAVVRMLIDSGAALDSIDEVGLTPLQWAAKNGHLPVVELLLKCQANTAVESKWGARTALHLAAQQGHEEVVRLLLDSIPDVDLDKGQYSPLHLAAAQGHESIARLLLERGASVNATSMGGKTALHYAASTGQEQTIKLLLNHGADIDARGGPGQFLTISKDGEGIGVLGEVILGGSQGGQTPLHLAVLLGKESIIELLLSKGADPNAKDEDNRTALHWAIDSPVDNEPVARLLLKAGADVNARASKPLRFSIGGSRISTTGEKGVTALHLATFYGRRSVAQLLLDHHIEINAKDEKGMTALHLAAYIGHPGMAKLLLDNGADPDARDADGRTVLGWAADENPEGLAPLLNNEGNDYFHSTEVMRLLIDKGIDIDGKDLYGRTVLHQAAREGRAGMVSMLLEKGADPMITDGAEWTALHWAAHNKGECEAVVRLSLKDGANPDIRNEQALRLLLDKAGPGAKEKSKGGKAYLAAYMKLQPEAYQTLLDMESKRLAAGKDSRSALYSAAMRWTSGNDNSAAIRMLLENGADIIFGREDVIRQIAERGSNIETKDENGQTALHVAVSTGNAGVARMLIEYGADPQAKDGQGVTALYLAAYRGDTAMTQALLEKNGGINSTYNQGMNLLHLAAYLGHDSVAETLLEKGADVYAHDDLGMTPLHLAAWLGKDAVVRQLLNWTDIDVKSDRGLTALQLAAKGGRQEVVELLLECGADTEHEDKSGRTALLMAAQEGHDAVIWQFISMNCDINAEKCKYSPLHVAASQGRESTVRLLLDNGADVHAKHKDGNTPLHWAAGRGSEAIVRMLLDRGVDVNATGNGGQLLIVAQNRNNNNEDILAVVQSPNMKGGQTPIHLAAGWGKEAIVKLLLTKGADPNIRDADGRAALHWAVECTEEHEEMVRLLIDKGADLTMKISRALRWQLSFGNQEADELNTQANEDGLTALHLATFSKYEAVARLLINSDIDVNTRDKSGMTALQLAAYLGYEMMIRLLLESGADPSIKDKFGRTALHWAVDHANEPIKTQYPPGFEDLIGNPNMENMSLVGFKPLAMESVQGRDVIVKLLLAKGVDPNSIDNNDETPLVLAARHGRDLAVQLLIESGGVEVETNALRTVETEPSNTPAAYTPHPHQNLTLPQFISASSQPMMKYPKDLPLDKVAIKLGKTGTEKPVVAMMQFLTKSRVKDTTQVTLPDLRQWSTFLQTSFQKLQPDMLFPLVDIFRLALMDSRVSTFYAEERNYTTIQALIKTTTTNTSYQLRLVTLHAVCNLFSTPLFPRDLVKAPLITLLIALVSASLLGEANPRLRVAAAALVFNITAYNQRIRTDSSEEIKERTDALSEDDQIQLLAVIIEALDKEKDSVEALVGLTLSLGLIVYGARVESNILNFVEILEAGRITREKVQTFTEKKLLVETNLTLCMEIGEQLL